MLTQRLLFLSNLSSSGPDTSIVFSIAGDSIISDYPCVAKVITADGIEVTDTLYLQSQLTWKKLGESPAINSLRNYSVSFKGSIFLFASISRSVDTIWKCWSSPDGITWIPVSDSLPITFHNNILVFKDKLWAFDRSSGAKPVIWHSDDGFSWSAEIIDGIPNDLYSAKYDVWTTWKDRLVLVNYYPLCLDSNSCNEGVTNCWESYNGSDWQALDLTKSVFPDKYDKPNINFAAVDLDGSLFIGGGWRALGLVSPFWTAYSFRVWEQAIGSPLYISFPIPVNTNLSFNELEIEIVALKGKLFMITSADPGYVWVLLEKNRWVRCSHSYPADNDPNHACLAHNEGLFSISKEGVWTVSENQMHSVKQ